MTSAVKIGQELYRGKAKTIYACDVPEHYVMEYRDDTSAFDGTKLAKLARKGMVNNHFNAFIMQHLQQAGIATHFTQVLTPERSLVKKLEMIPVECVVRNAAAGGLCRRLGVTEGRLLDPAILELFYKDDNLHDPMINEYSVITFGWASAQEIETMKALSFKVNDVLKPLFEKAGFLLVDYKLEFGRSNGKIILGDEFTPDGCRIWDIKTGERYDKDRFRKDLGQVIEFYEIAAQRLGVTLFEHS